MVKTQKGFTLIELVMVIVILGILAAVAIPKYIDLSTDANKAALQGVAGTMASSFAVNYASRSLSTGATYGTLINDCSQVGTIMSGGAPAGYNVTPAGAFGANPGDTTTCTVTQVASGNTATFIGIRSR